LCSPKVTKGMLRVCFTASCVVGCRVRRGHIVSYHHRLDLGFLLEGGVGPAMGHGRRDRARALREGGFVVYSTAMVNVPDRLTIELNGNVCLTAVAAHSQRGDVPVAQCSHSFAPTREEGRECVYSMRVGRVCIRCHRRCLACGISGRAYGSAALAPCTRQNEAPWPWSL